MHDWSIEYNRELGRSVTFIPNKRVPIHNWFYFKEGFAKEFVEFFLKRFEATREDVVLDPFCGVGTTPLTCKELGMNSAGVDALPLMVFVSSVKTRDYDLRILKGDCAQLLNARFERTDTSGVRPFVKQFFKPSVLEEILFYRDQVGRIADRSSRDFLLLALMDAATKASYMFKDGSFIRVVKHPVPPFRKFYGRRCRVMLRGLEAARFPPGTKTTVLLGDARDLSPLAESSFDIAITSPPYLNKIEYTKVYAIEQELFFGRPNADPLRSCIGLRLPDLESETYASLPPVARAYFADVAQALAQLRRVLKAGARVALVVAGCVFPTGPVESDLIIADLAQGLDFDVTKILAVNYRTATDPRGRKIGSSRESILIMQKPKP